ncbi:hypothetical protein OsJ_14141 [Oryza sativa Japonica Group]|jgi:hypothetical protein|uniref:Uncharacterized protein n=1 Tax=Oryza sativa subsp. japonica TaxID=39947 RepID=A3ARZ1_ORYSJ|nr:hypothetical protein OsJ_14141 [Oryza sativa Japonica Group]
MRERGGEEAPYLDIVAQRRQASLDLIHLVADVVRDLQPHRQPDLCQPLARGGGSDGGRAGDHWLEEEVALARMRCRWGVGTNARNRGGGGGAWEGERK